jgi:hypothetical protein
LVSIIFINNLGPTQFKTRFGSISYDTIKHKRYPLGKKEKEKREEGRWAFWKVKCPFFVASGFYFYFILF